MISTQVSIPGYKVSEQLYNGSRTLVYRGIRETDSFPVAIKLLKNPYPNFNELVQFRNQYTIAKNLNFPGIIQTISLEPYQNGYMLVMEDFGGISLNDYFAKNVTFLQEFLQIAISLCDTLDILSRERIIHKDIKPANILINPDTKQVKLIDFSIASLLPKEIQELKNINVLEGTLSYISPEQTGRMNRVIDYRSDFYSLGVTFYELLTDELPFQSNDAMELVHCHIAKIPDCVSEIKSEIPKVVGKIISKLMAKNAEDRYQSALGLKHDLEKCLYQFKETGKIGSFEIAQRDICDRFIIPDKLYGRETEVSTLLQAFERVSQDATEMMLVAGFSGIGKTAVVNEIHKPIVRQRGYFIKGKYDQFQRNIPFSAFVQAFRDLIGQLLTLSDAQIQAWKNQILEAVGENGQVIIEVIPELEIIIGKQPPATELSGTAAENRFNLLFQKFTQVFTSIEHPLVMFLDDLQWADLASLKLIQLLMADTKHLFLIGAYRDNEVHPAHPLMLTLAEIQKTFSTINTITLAPLSPVQVNHLVADTLKCTEDSAWTLSKLVSQKTQGNPFFATQFLKALYEDGLIEFNFESGYWQCDITQVTQQAVTDDVVEFMALQLRKLPLSTQNLLQLAACIANQFDLATLAIVSESSSVETASCLWKALQEGLILPISDVYKFYQSDDGSTPWSENHESSNKQVAQYKFLHDRVQQAAYSLIPDDRKQKTHYQIGQLLLQQISPEAREERIFELVHQLNYGTALIVQPEEREELAQLNLIAGQKAIVSTAYTAATKYLCLGIELLNTNSWEHQYDLTLALHSAAVEASFLNSNFAQMEIFASQVLQQVKTLFDGIKVYEVQITTCTIQNRTESGLQIALEVLEKLNVRLPKQANLPRTILSLGATKLALVGKPISSLETLPEMTTQNMQAAIRLLATSLPAAYVGKPDFLPLLIFKALRLLVKYGNHRLSSYIYACYGIILCAVTGEIEAGYEFGQLAIALLKRFNAKEIEAKTRFTIYAFINHWKYHARNVLPLLLETYQVALETGDIEQVASSIYTHCVTAYLVGDQLNELEQKYQAYGKVMAEIRQDRTLNYHQGFHQIILNLLGHGDYPAILQGEVYNEAEALPKLIAAGDKSGVACVYIHMMMLGFWFGDEVQSLSSLEKVYPYLEGITSTFLLVTFYLYSSLIQLEQYPKAAIGKQKHILKQVAENQKKFRTWKNHCHANIEHKFYLVEAEKSRVLGQWAQAQEMYDRAISGAKENQFLNEEALANELAGKFYLNWGKEKVAAGYMQEAYYCYARWGAKAKVVDLETHYPQLLQHILQQPKPSFNVLETLTSLHHNSIHSSTQISSSSISDALDFASVIKAAQALSSTIQLDELLKQLTQLILQNSGGDKCVLVLSQDDIWQVRAIATLENTILCAESLDNHPNVPIKLIQYVKRTQTAVTIDNLETDLAVIDEYLSQRQPKSVLCLPILNQGHLAGILYLKNRSTAGVFTSDRILILNFLCTQAAISLENARLYQQAQQALQDLQQAQLQIVQSEKMSALGNLVAGVAHEMNNPLGFISASLLQAKPSFADISEHLKLYQEILPNPSEEILDHAESIDLGYSLEDLPKMMDAMVMACDRLKNISTSLRTFSRADKDYKVSFNIHEGIDSTILILKHRLKANENRPAIEVVTNYGNLPQVQCFPGQLNQVFMNLLANAIDALDESNNGRSFGDIKANPNIITVQTSLENNQIKISIADNGKGMSEEVQQKIFDHLFTTKEVGKGTGLGLAIAKQIIEETHGGKLICNSIVGEGAEFFIELPI
jgi:predicted ATPase/signal transduction histidine kinase/tRNA A-37 threonylcarbamoyl transferase component Bud32